MTNSVVAHVCWWKFALGLCLMFMADVAWYWLADIVHRRGPDGAATTMLAVVLTACAAWLLIWSARIGP